jgi:hypothetical protein
MSLLSKLVYKREKGFYLYYDTESSALSSLYLILYPREGIYLVSILLSLLLLPIEPTRLRSTSPRASSPLSPSPTRLLSISLRYLAEPSYTLYRLDGFL